MKKNIKLIGKYLFTLLISGLVIFSGCRKHENYEEPTLPPENAFAIDFSAIDKDTTQLKAMAQTEGYTNFAHSGIQVWVWSVVINAYLAIPVAAYKVAISQVPEQLEDDEWLWSFTTGVQNAQYMAELYGKVLNEGADVKWQMDISYDAPIIGFSDFTWYTGTMNSDITKGQWILKESKANNWNFIQIDWNRSSTVDVWDITYTNIKENDGGNGDYIYHGWTADTDYNAFFNIYDKSDNNLVEIQWNRTYNNGRVKNPKFFGDQNWHCWDNAYLDCECGK